MIWRYLYFGKPSFLHTADICLCSTRQSPRPDHCPRSFWIGCNFVLSPPLESEHLPRTPPRTTGCGSWPVIVCNDDSLLGTYYKVPQMDCQPLWPTTKSYSPSTILSCVPSQPFSNFPIRLLWRLFSSRAKMPSSAVTTWAGKDEEEFAYGK